MPAITRYVNHLRNWLILMNPAQAAIAATAVAASVALGIWLGLR